MVIFSTLKTLVFKVDISSNFATPILRSLRTAPIQVLDPQTYRSPVRLQLLNPGQLHHSISHVAQTLSRQV